MQFVFQPLVWGFLAVCLPLLIHLINLMRHRRQKWAAMEFLLESYKKHRRWVWLKQALLLLSRMLIVAVAVAMLAQWISGSRFLTLFGQNVVHHYVLLDDSMSMADSNQETSAYQLGLRAINSIVQTAARDDAYHQITLIRFSRSELATKKNSEGDDTSDERRTESDERSTVGSDGASANSSFTETPQADVAADFLARTIPADPTELLDRINSTKPVPMEFSGQNAVDMARAVIERASGEQSIVYLVSDFRESNWTNPGQIRNSLESIDSSDLKIELIDCATSQNQNLTLVSIKPDQEVLAAGVPSFVQVQIRNNGVAVARNIQLQIRAVDYSETNGPNSQEEFSGEVIDLPPILISSIAQGETISRRAQVVFAKPGSHVVTAELPGDSLSLDNQVSCVMEIEQGERVLLVDGDPEQRNAFQIESAIAPGQSARTGLIVKREVPESLRDLNAEELLGYRCIYLLAVDRLDDRAIANLEKYAAAGGGICIIPSSDFGDATVDHFNDKWYRNGSGILPCSLSEVIDLEASADQGTADIVPEPHPITRTLFGLRNSPFQFVRLSKFVQFETDLPRTDNSQDDDVSSAVDENIANASETDSSKTGSSFERGPLRTIAVTRTRQPLIVGRSFGDGRVILFGTSLDRSWTNWPQDPTMVIMLLKTTGYLGSFRQPEFSQRIGDAVELTSFSREIVPSVEVLLPQMEGAMLRTELELPAIPMQRESGDNLDSGEIRASLVVDPQEETEQTVRAKLQPGVVELWATRLDGERYVKNVAQNAPPSEGDLALLTSQELTQAMQPVRTKYRTAASLESASLAASLASRNMFLLCLLVVLMLVEQVLAWSASYHSPKTIARGVT